MKMTLLSSSNKVSCGEKDTKLTDAQKCSNVDSFAKSEKLLSFPLGKFTDRRHPAIPPLKVFV